MDSQENVHPDACGAGSQDAELFLWQHPNDFLTIKDRQQESRNED